MPATPTLPGYARRIRRYRSQCLFHFRAADGTLQALTGQVGTLTREGTATGTDAWGSTITYRDHQAVWTTLNGRAAVLLNASTVLAWPLLRAEKPMGAVTGYVSMRHAGLGYTSGGTGIVIANAAIGNPLWAIIGNNGTNDGKLNSRHHNGTSDVSSALGTGIADATECEYLATLSAGGVVQLTRVTAAGATSVATASSAAAQNASGFSEAMIRATAGMGLYVLKLVAGARTLDEMRELS